MLFRSHLYDKLHEIFKNERYGDARTPNAGINSNDDSAKERYVIQIVFIKSLSSINLDYGSTY